MRPSPARGHRAPRGSRRDRGAGSGCLVRRVRHPHPVRAGRASGRRSALWGARNCRRSEGRAGGRGHVDDFAGRVARFCGAVAVYRRSLRRRSGQRRAGARRRRSADDHGRRCSRRFHGRRTGAQGDGNAASFRRIANVEALVFAQRAGADLDAVCKVLATATASNYVLERWLPKTWLAGSFEGGFALDLLRKDVAAALQAARETSYPMPATALAYQLYTARSAQGDGALDYSAIAKSYERNVGDEVVAGRIRQEPGLQ